MLNIVTNAATSGVVGDIVNDGSISGFETSTHVGSAYATDATTEQSSNRFR
jgi:hypothetical protein